MKDVKRTVVMMRYANRSWMTDRRLDRAWFTLARILFMTGRGNDTDR